MMAAKTPTPLSTTYPLFKPFMMRSVAAHSSSSSSSSSTTESPVGKIRNVGIIAHIDAGKTTTTERMLYYSGYSRLLGDVDDGDTVTDFMDQERERGITIKSAAVTFNWRKHKINLIDTPGHVDFTVEVERAIRVMDGAVAILDGVIGVEAQSRTVWRQASRYNVPRIVYINKMDKEGADFKHSINTIVQKLECTPIAVQFPITQNGQFHGVVDLISMETIEWSDEKGETLVRRPASESIDPTLLKQVVQEREHMLEQLVELDEQMGDLYLEGNLDQVTSDVIRSALRRIVLTQKAVVVMCGASFRNKGVQPVLDAIVDYLPSPLECVLPTVQLPGKKNQIIPVSLEPNEKAPTVALAFKIVHDQHKGPLTFFRVYSGALSAKDTIFNSNKGTREKPNKLMLVLADQTVDVPQVTVGNIGAAVGLKSTQTGDTLVTEDRLSKHVQLQGVKLPEPVFFCSIEPESSTDQKALDVALEILQREDPSFHVKVDPNTGQTLMCGMGELHLEILQTRIKREFNIEAVMGRVQIAYRENINKPVTMTLAYDRVFGNKRLQATLTLRVESSERGVGNQFVVQLQRNKCDPSIEALNALASHVNEGFQDACMRGVLLGFPLEDITVTLIGGQIVSGSPAAELTQSAFRACANQLIMDALNEGGIHLLEPVMLVEITTDSQYVGPVVSNLSNSRRAKLRGIDTVTGGDHIITAEVPLVEMLGYSTQLRSITQGNSHFFMEFLKHDDLSEDQQRKIILEHRGF